MPGILHTSDDWEGKGNGLGGPTGPTGTTPTTYAESVVPETGTLQILLSEGEVEGLVDGLKSVYLDNTPILASDGTTFNFKGIAMALVAGTNAQARVKGITGTESETAVSVQVVQATPVTRSITSNPSAVRVRIAIPALKVVSSTDGKSSGNTVTIKIERQNAAWNGGAWEVVSLEGGGVISGGPYSTKLTKAYRIDTPATGTWQIRVSRVSADDVDAYHLSPTWWDAYTEIVDVKLRYPNSAVLSMRLNAKQFRSIPQINVLMKGKKVQIPANYNPVTRAYATTGTGTSAGAWDGTFTTAWTDNPAWVWYDAATQTRYGAGSFLAAAQIDKWTLYSIAQWCDTLVNDGKGGTEPRMVCNLYLQGQQNAIKALGQLASIFWGVAYYASGLVVPVADSDASPVALFNNSNVQEGRFSYEGTARQARHTAALVAFTNPDMGYDRDVAVYEAGADSTLVTALGFDPSARYGYNALDLQGIGCTSQGQALRLAKWSILSELMAPETCTFVAGLEGSTCKPGDVIQVADQFRAGHTRAGGRVVSATTTAITLDAPVTLTAGAYTLKCQTATGMETRTVSTGAGTTSTIVVASAFSSAPAAGAGWVLQAGSTASLWRVLSVSKGEGLNHTITGLLHDPAKYTALGLGSGDVITRTGNTYTSPAPTGLALAYSTRTLVDRQVQTLSASWTLDGAMAYTAQASRDNGPWEDMVVTGASALLDSIQPGTWQVRVAGTWRLGGMSPWAMSAISTASSTNFTGWMADIADDWVITDQEKAQARQELDTIKRAWEVAWDAATVRYGSVTTDMINVKDSLWKMAYQYMAPIFYTVTGFVDDNTGYNGSQTYDAYGSVVIANYGTTSVGLRTGAWQMVATGSAWNKKVTYDMMRNGLTDAPVIMQRMIAQAPASSSQLGAVKQGTNVTIASDGTISASSTLGTTATWGSITGTLSAQTDLNSALSGKVATSLLGAASGVAQLDSGGKVPAAQLPSYVDDVLEVANYAALPGTGETGKIYLTLDTNKCYRWSGSAYVYITSGAVDSVAGKTGVVSLVKGDVGLGNVDNTTDLLKPISTATQNALDLKAPIASPTFTGTVGGITKTMVGLSAVENTALSTWAGTSNVTTLGTIGTGTWQGTAVADTYIASAATWHGKQAALGYTPINKAGDTGIGNLSMGALTATTGLFSTGTPSLGIKTTNAGTYASPQGRYLQFQNYLGASTASIVADDMSASNSATRLNFYVLNTAGTPSAYLVLDGYNQTSIFASSVSMGALTATTGLFTATSSALTVGQSYAGDSLMQVYHATLGGMRIAYNGTAINYLDSGTLYFRNATGTDNYAVINASGNVGIGTTAPGSKLTINTGTNYNAGFRPSTEIGLSGGTALQFHNDSRSAFAFGSIDGSTLVLNASSGGNVGIGNTAPGYKLDVTGTASFTGALYMNSATQTLDRSSNDLRWRYDGTNYGIIYHSGNIDTSVAGTQALKALINSPEVGNWATYGALPATTGVGGNYPPGRYIYSTVIVDTAGDNTAGTLYQNQSGTWVRVGSGTVIAGKIVAGNISAGSIGTAALAAGSITAVSGIIGSLAVTTGNIQDAAITNAKIGSLAVQTANIADANITTAKIANLAVTDALIANATISSAKIASLTADKITTGTLSATLTSTGVLKSTGAALGNATTAPVGFTLTGTPYTSTCLNDPYGASVTLPNTVMELGGEVNFGGYPLSTLAIGKLVNGGIKEYTASGDWICPVGISFVEVTLCGAGGGGYGSRISPSLSSGTGGGGGGMIRKLVPVTAGTAYRVTVGAGGTGGSGSTGAGNTDGGDTKFSLKNSPFTDLLVGGGGKLGKGGSLGGGNGGESFTGAGDGGVGGVTGVAPVNKVLTPGAEYILRCGGGGGGNGSVGGYQSGGSVDLKSGGSGGSGGGGGASAFGRGGISGAGTPGETPPNYGGGGGGGGEQAGTLNAGGNGAPGYALLRW